MGKSLNQAKANAIRYTKKKVEHWQLVSLALAGYDANSRQTVSDINKDWLIYRGFSDYKTL